MKPECLLHRRDVGNDLGTGGEPAVDRAGDDEIDPLAVRFQRQCVFGYEGIARRKPVRHEDAPAGKQRRSAES